ncbi:hypothetical protein [Nafulsella turpanensis]|uniref:hypothetical protein n=1 Tax=Nafulsella turpanensis TaxID=1265690 RepID=UPI000348F836|nr:hypothetical protein [Nafulsella turpanensis]
MKIKYVFFSIVAALLLGAAFYFYTSTTGETASDAWGFVPEHAVWIYETEQPQEVWGQLQQSPMGEILAGLPWFVGLKNNKQLLDSASSGKLATFLEDRHLLISAHITESNNFGYLFYLPLQGLEDYDALEQVLRHFKNDSLYRYGKRNYQGLTVEEFSAPEAGKRFSYLLHEGYLLGSFAPFLVEDVIRQLTSPEEKGFRKHHASLFQLSESAADEGNLYVNGQELGNYLNIFLKENSFQPALPFEAKLDVSLNEDGLLLNGYLLPEASQASPYLSSLLSASPQTPAMTGLVPLNTATLEFYGFSNGLSWLESLQAAGAIPGWSALVEEFPAAAVLPASIGTHLALARIPAPGEEKPHQLLYLHSPRAAERAEEWEALAATFSEAGSDSLYQEVFSGHAITQLAYPELPEAFLGTAFPGFEETFFVQLDDYLVLSNSVQALKSLLLDIESDLTWEKSLPFYQFMEKTNQETNWGYYVNVEEVWKQLLAKAEPEWKALLEQQGPYLRQFSRLAMQISSLEEMFYASLFLQAQPGNVQELEGIRLTTVHESFLEVPLISGPMLARNPEDKSREVLVQDTLYQLHLLDAQGDLQKKDSLGAPLVADIFQPDVRKNGKPHYLAVTKEGLHFYDASFSMKEGFPLRLPGEAPAAQANVIDYNGSKMYRIMVAAESGDIFMYDTEGNNLEGWQPRVLDGGLSAAPGHLRVRGKDFIYAFQQKGVIQLLNRRGEQYKGFPLNLKDSLLGPVLIRPGSDFKSTRFTTVTKGGELVSFNLNGRITGQEQLYKPEADTRFFLVPDQEEENFLIARQTRYNLSLLDEEGKLLFEKDYLGAEDVVVQYFSYGADKEVIAVTDPVEAFTFLYDREGKLLNMEPLNSCCPVQLLYQENDGSYELIRSYGNKVSLMKGE